MLSENISRSRTAPRAFCSRVSQKVSCGASSPARKVRRHFSLRPIASLCAGGGLAQLTNPSHAPRSGKWFLPWLADKYSLRSSCIPAPPFKSRPGKNSNRREARSRLNCFLCRRRDLSQNRGVFVRAMLSENISRSRTAPRAFCSRVSQKVSCGASSPARKVRRHFSLRPIASLCAGGGT